MSEEDPWVARFWDRNYVVPVVSLCGALKDHQNRAVNNVSVRVLAHKPHLSLDLIWKQIVVGIEVLQPGRTCEREQPVTGRVGTTVRASFPADVLTKTLDDVETTIGRTIVER